jgi:DNA (cytosine-5)-methyltransferase 1
MRVGELFAGIGGASLAVGMVIPDAETVWQADLVGEAVRARRFPGAQQLVGDVREVDPARLPRVDLLTAGFPCQDLSVAGKGAGLDGERSGLYSEVLRFAKAMSPERVLIENVPALLHYLPRLSADFRALGYGLTWAACEAADAGLPHLRRRVFVLAELDRAGRGAVEVDQAGRWRPEGLQAWPTPTVCGNDNRAGASPTSGDGLGTAVRLWPTPRADEARTSGGRTGREGVGESLTYAARPWASPRASDADRSSDPDRAGGGTGGIVGQVRLWPTAVQRDYKTGDTPNRTGTEALSSAAGAAEMGLFGRRLSPAWVEALMGYPIGWTDRYNEPQPLPGPVRGRYPVGWDRREPWPGFAWEPLRTLPDGVKAPWRVPRLKGLGNAWAPAQGALALRALLASPAQVSLFGS